MRPRIFTFRYSSTLGGFDDTALREYVASEEVLAFREHFFTVNDVPHLLCVVETQAPVSPTRAEPAISRGTTTERPRDRRSDRKEAPDPLADLDESQRLFFQSIREWRSETAREEGVPPYVILTNRELRAIVRSRGSFHRSPTRSCSRPSNGSSRTAACSAWWTGSSEKPRSERTRSPPIAGSPSAT